MILTWNWDGKKTEIHDVFHRTEELGFFQSDWIFVWECEGHTEIFGLKFNPHDTVHGEIRYSTKMQSVAGMITQDGGTWFVAQRVSGEVRGIPNMHDPVYCTWKSEPEESGGCEGEAYGWCEGIPMCKACWNSRETKPPY